GISCVDRAPEPWPRLGAFRCTAGEVVACPCPLGGVGESTCQADGVTIGPCTCPDEVARHNDDSDVTVPLPSPEPDNGNGGGTTPTPAPEDTAAPDDTGLPSFDVAEDTGPEPEPTGGACVNEVQGTDVQANLQLLEEDAWSLGTLCNENSPANIVGCVQDAMVTGHGLSNGCALCFAGYVVCTLSSCAQPCANYGSPQCLDCRTSNCVPDWATCMNGP
ncbi:MAG: hypothetical protein VX938_13155, partial [Myxococcota bacterium]|nr:hypothetical protein [Myxococcota bacterium]